MASVKSQKTSGLKMDVWSPERLAKELVDNLKLTQDDLIGELKCQDCGRTNPPCGFYPMMYIGTKEKGGQLCWDCDKKRREESKHVGNL